MFSIVDGKKMLGALAAAASAGTIMAGGAFAAPATDVSGSPAASPDPARAGESHAQDNVIEPKVRQRRIFRITNIRGNASAFWPR